MKRIAFGIIILLLTAAVLTAGCTTPMPEPVSEPLHTATTSASVSASPSATASITSTPTPTPTPTPTLLPKPQCNYVDIFVSTPSNTPCNHCAQMYGQLSSYYANSPYVTVSGQNTTELGVIATVRETGQTQSFTINNYTVVEEWADSVLTCK